MQGIQQQVAQHLKDASSGKHVVAKSGDVEVHLDFQETGPIGVSVNRIRVARPALDGAGARQACHRVEDKVRYLMEPLQVIEADVDSGVTQVRSAKPTVDADGRHYFELEGRQGQLDLQRYRKPQDTARENEPMRLTHEQLLRLAEDLADAVVVRAPG